MAWDFAKDRDWDANASWNSGTAPVNGDDAAIPGTLNLPMDQGLDQSLVDLNTLWVQSGYVHPIGGTGNTLRIQANLVRYQGSGGLYLDAPASGALAGIERIIIEAANSGVPIELGAEASDAGDMPDVVINRGSVKFLGTALFGASGVVTIGHMENRLSDANVEFVSNTDTLPSLNIQGGTVKSAVAMTTCEISHATMMHEAKTIVNLDIRDGGDVTYNHTALTTVRVFSGGVLDLSKFFALDMTVTTLEIHTGGIVYGVISEGQTPVEGPIVVTNLRKLGGIILPTRPTA